MNLYDSLSETAARQGMPEVERTVVNWLAGLTIEGVESLHKAITDHLEDRRKLLRKTRNA